MTPSRLVRLIKPPSPIAYADFLGLQERLVHGKLNGFDPVDYLLVMEHSHPVFTGGRRSKGTVPEVPGAQVFETGRGGQLTWHGPGQLCLYPILDLTHHGRSLHRYVGQLEAILMRTCSEFGVATSRGVDRCNEVGVWTVDRCKIGFIGIRNTRWITSFGLSLNVSNDLSWFDHIVPCGLEGIQVTSLQREIGCPVALEQVKHSLVTSFMHIFNTEALP